MSGKEWIKVAVMNDPVEAEILRGLLEAQGIKVLMSKEAVGQVWGLTVGSASEVEFFVPKDQAKLAKEILREYVTDLSEEDQG